MNHEDLMIREYESLNDRRQAARQARDKATTLAGGFVVGLTTFIIRGDLPGSSYLFVAAVFLVAWVYIAGLSHYEVVLERCLRISESRLRCFGKNAFGDDSLFALTERIHYLRYGSPPSRALAKVPKLLLVVVLSGAYGFLVVRGLVESSLPAVLFWLYLIVGMALLVTFGVLGWFQHRNLKRRFATIAVRSSEEEGGARLRETV
jgi:hypothetical protein